MPFTFYDLISWILAGYFALLPMSNPFSTVPLLLSLTRGQEQQFQRSQGDRASILGAAIMIVTLFLGALILDFFNISVPALRVAGGFIVCFYGFNMLIQKSSAAKQDSEGLGTREDYAFIPLAMPSLVGPGTISIILTFATQINEQSSALGMTIGYSIMLLAIVATSATTLLVLRSSRVIMKLLGEKGIEVMTRIMGLILVCVGVQFIAEGIRGFILGFT